jgi:hypothetical protein
MGKITQIYDGLFTKYFFNKVFPEASSGQTMSSAYNVIHFGMPASA